MQNADYMSHDELRRRYSDGLTGRQVRDRTPLKPDTVWAGPGSPASQRVVTQSAVIGLVDTSNNAMSLEDNRKK